MSIYHSVLKFWTNWVTSLSTANILLHRNCWSFLFKFTPLFFVGFALITRILLLWVWLHKWFLLFDLHSIWYFLDELLLYFSSMFYFSVSNSCSAQFCPSFSSGLKSLAISPVWFNHMNDSGILMLLLCVMFTWVVFCDIFLSLLLCG